MSLSSSYLILAFRLWFLTWQSLIIVSTDLKQVFSIKALRKSKFYFNFSLRGIIRGIISSLNHKSLASSSTSCPSCLIKVDRSSFLERCSLDRYLFWSLNTAWLMNWEAFVRLFVSSPQSRRLMRPGAKFFGDES